MKLAKTLQLLILALIFTLGGCTKPKEWIVKSPDNKISFRVFEKENKLYYTVGFPDSLVIGESPLGITRKDVQFIENLALVSASQPQAISENYKMLVGKQLNCTYSANELALGFENDQKAKIDLIIRASNDGVAFRYRFPEKSSGSFEITKEITGFKFGETGKAWIEPYDSITRFSPAYEQDFTNGSRIGESSPKGEGWGFPALFQASNSWILLTEAGLDGSFCGSHLEQKAPEGLYRVRYPSENEAMGIGNANPQSKVLPWATPWRVIIIGKDPSVIVASTMVNGLSEPSKIADTSWIKPGLASWSWWAEPSSPKNYNSMIPYIDFSAEWGLPYFLVDANWNIMKGGNVEKLINYANKKGVGIWLWYNSGGSHNTVTEEPRDVMLDPAKRRAEFDKLQKWGVKGVKVDFFQSDKQHIIQQYVDIMRDAAEFHVMVNFHGCTIPRGWQRTWPNQIGMESVPGEECYMFRDTYPEDAVWHNTILPFTRNTLGSMDYTPFGIRDQKEKHLTTYSNELALTVVFESGIVHLADSPSIYKTLPDFVQTFVKQLPTVWDETKMIYGYPCRDVVIARRAAEKWFIGGINGEKTNKEISLNLDFLGEGKSYTAKLITDGADGKTFGSSSVTVKRGDRLPVKMLSCGGFSIVVEEHAI